MYFHVKRKPTGKDDWTDPRIRKVASDAWDEAQSLELKDAAAIRRQKMKGLRFAKGAVSMGAIGGEQAVRERRAATRAVRRNMEKRING